MGWISTIYLLIIGITLIGDSSAEICTKAVCDYEFDIAWGRTMTTHHEGLAFPVVSDGKHLRVVESLYRQKSDYGQIIGRTLSPEVVITADGVERDIITINGQFPGPTIEVMEGAEVSIRVRNRLLLHSTSVHWHGLHQKGTPFMDGAAYISQCPILPGHSFTYRFVAKPAGTHWYHSHLLNQKSDGLYGAFIIHASLPKIPYFSLVISDWFHETASSLAAQNPVGLIGLTQRGPGQMFMKNPSNQRANGESIEITTLKMTSSLINGRGRYGHNSSLHLTEFEVDSGQRHRLRVVCAAQEVGFTLSVDQHKLDLVALDGEEIQTTRVDALMIHPGESVDFVLHADQARDRYWLRTSAMQHGSDTMEGMVEHHQEGKMHHAVVESVRAVLSYKGSHTGSDPSSEPRVPSPSDPYLTFGCPYREKTVDRRCIGLELVRSIKLNTQEFGLDTPESDVIEKFINVGYAHGSSINGRQFVHPTSPLYGVDDVNEVVTACDLEDCKDGCQCTNMMELPLNKTVQLVISNLQPCASTVVHHSIHLHGHNFAVLTVGYDEEDVDDDTDHHMHGETTPVQNSHNLHNDMMEGAHGDSASDCKTSQGADIDCDTPLCANPSWRGAKPDLNLKNPPVRDTVSIPAKGYAVVRFRTTNPGYWIVHCHNSMHLMEGMALLIQEGNKQQIPNSPSDFPTCHNFEFSSENLHDYKTHNKEANQHFINGMNKIDDEDSGKLILPVSTFVVCSIALFVIGFIVACIPSICISTMRKSLESKKSWNPLRDRRLSL